MAVLDDISKELGVTKQNVNQILKRAMRKIYWKTQELNKEFTPLEVVFALSYMLNIQSNDFKRFFNDFPADIKRLVEEFCIENKLCIFKSEKYE